MEIKETVTSIIEFWISCRSDPYGFTYYSGIGLEYVDYLDHRIIRLKVIPKWVLITYAVHGFNFDEKLLARSYFRTRKQAINYIPEHEKNCLLLSDKYWSENH
ncbi:MAG: hypothetical protein EAZ76_10835 [Nostocales cyanobacterium]|nr:MAG: hypothetical protein EAZ87_11850 [Nostocales cyanobacterium]TAF13796.1 MAG: hypothetical protein EAZ76_10835 [Nostocales cyanobacterium]